MEKALNPGWVGESVGGRESDRLGHGARWDFLAEVFRRGPNVGIRVAFDRGRSQTRGRRQQLYRELVIAELPVFMIHEYGKPQQEQGESGKEERSGVGEHIQIITPGFLSCP